VRERKLRKHEIDDVLRRTLADDLPEETAEQLRIQMRQAWRGLAIGTTLPERDPLPGLAFLRAWPTRRPPRALLTAAALLMAVGGSVVHLAAPPRLLAESLSAQHTASRVARHLGRVAGMDCLLGMSDADGRPLRYRLEWRSSGQTDVRMEQPDATFRLSLRLPEERVSLIGLARGPSPAAATLPEEAWLLPVRGYLTPGRIADLLAGRWLRSGDSCAERPGTATFSVSTTRHPAPIRVTIDTQTDLPLCLEAAGAGPEGALQVRAQFDWTSGLSPVYPLQGRGLQEGLSRTTEEGRTHGDW
jgi:hypothetical protein